VFARPHEEEEPNNYHLGHREGFNMAVVNREARRMVDNLDRNGLDSGWRGIALGVATKLPGYLEVGLALGVVSGVRGPHACHGLRHCA
jgi:hypothetical protein